MNQVEDVEVILGHKRHYKFHAGTLARNSTLLADMLTERKAAKLNSRARAAGVKIRWMIELVQLPSAQNPAGVLELVELNANGERAEPRPPLIVNENGRIPQATRAWKHYESVFYAFYNKEVAIDDTDMSAALSDCYELLTISDYLGCTALISKPIEVALLKHGQDLFRAIQGAPQAWVEMAYRIRSEMVFSECVVHLVGDWKNFKLRGQVVRHLKEVPGLLAVVEKYHHQLQDKCRRFEIGILSLYPGTMQRPTDDIPIKREVYAKDMLVWMALTFFRHWISQRLLNDKGRHARDSGYELYKQIGTGGEAYMDRTVINQFHTRFPITKKALNVLENHVSEIKECMKKVVEQHGILESKTHLDVNRFPVNYLTCIKFEREDFPWAKDDAQEVKAHVTPPKRKYQPGGNDVSRHNLELVRRFQERSVSAGVVGSDDLEEEQEAEEELQQEEGDKEVESEEDARASTRKRARIH